MGKGYGDKKKASCVWAWHIRAHANPTRRATVELLLRVCIYTMEEQYPCCMWQYIECVFWRVKSINALKTCTDNKWVICLYNEYIAPELFRCWWRLCLLSSVVYFPLSFFVVFLLLASSVPYIYLTLPRTVRYLIL